MRVGNSSSKYDYNPELLDKDIADKMQVMDDFKRELKELMLKKIEYHDGSVMGEIARRICIMESVRDIWEQRGWT